MQQGHPPHFKNQALLDEAALLACMAYVDLNPARAGLATSLADSDFTSVQQRVQRLPQKDGVEARVHRRDRLQTIPLAPFTGDPAGRRSCGPALPIRRGDYIRLVEATGRLAVPGKRGVLPKDCEPILQRLVLSPDQWRLLSLTVQAAGLSSVGNLGQLRRFCNDTGRSRLTPLGVLKQVYPL